MAVWTAVPYVNIFFKIHKRVIHSSKLPIPQSVNLLFNSYKILKSVCDFSFTTTFETNQHELVNHTLLIDASEQTQIQRASQRDGQNQEQIQKIIAAQMPRERKRELANDIVFNDGLLEHLYQQLEPLHQSYLKRAN